jgi:hypothetical protein
LIRLTVDLFNGYLSILIIMYRRIVGLIMEDELETKGKESDSSMCNAVCTNLPGELKKQQRNLSRYS